MARPTTYKAEYALLARNYCLLGATEAELGDLFEVSDRTIRNWKRDYPKFAEAISMASMKPNARVVGKLYDECMKGNVTAIIWWTKNKMGWREKQDIELSGKNGGPVVTRIEMVALDDDDGTDKAAS